MSWEALCGDGWTVRLAGWLAAKLVFVVFASHVLRADYKIIVWTTFADFVGAFMAVLA